MPLLLLEVIIIIVLDFGVSMMEAAILATPLHRARLLAKKGRHGGKALLRLREFSEESITTIISLSNLITIIGSALTGVLAARIFGNNWVWLFAAVLTFLIMVFGEIIPKRLGQQYNDIIAPRGATAILVISKLFMPLTFLITLALRPFLRKKLKQTSEEEIAYLASIGGSEGTIKEYESFMIQKVFKLDDITAADIMTPRSFVFTLEGSRTLGETMMQVMESPFAYIPIYKDAPDKIVGVAGQSKLLQAFADDKKRLKLKDLADKPLVVPEDRPGEKLLRDLQRADTPLGIVTDRRGRMLGVVSLQDVVAEIVGETAEEKEVAPELVKRVARNEVLVHGQTQVDFLNRFFNTDLPDHRTVSALLVDEIGHLPKTGQAFILHDLTFQIEAIRGKNIEKVRILRKSS